MSEDPSSAQLRAARAMLDWSLVDLSKSARVSVSSIKRAETERQTVPHETLTSIEGAFEAEGITFLADDGSGSGLRKRQKS